jgi:hypothetical protein
MKKMKKLTSLILFLTLLVSCKEDDASMEPSAFFAPVSGQWFLKEVEVFTVDNKSSWEKVAANLADTITFRYDGVLLQTDGQPTCCPPKSLTVNGQLVDIVPQTSLAYNPECALVNCVYCPLWELTITGNEMIVKSCINSRRKYVR